MEMRRRHEPPLPTAALVNMGAVLGQRMLTLNVAKASAKPGGVNPTTAGWFKRSEITESQVAVFRGVANHALLLVRLVDPLPKEESSVSI